MVSEVSLQSKRMKPAPGEEQRGKQEGEEGGGEIEIERERMRKTTQNPGQGILLT